MDMTNSQPALLTGPGFALSPLAYCFHCHGRDFVCVEGFAERYVCNQHNGMAPDSKAIPAEHRVLLGRNLMHANPLRDYLTVGILAYAFCGRVTGLAKWHGFTVSGVPQLFGDKVTLAGAATMAGCT